MTLIQYYYVLVNIRTDKVQRLKPSNFSNADTDSVNSWAMFDTVEDALRWRDMIKENEDLKLRKVSIRVE